MAKPATSRRMCGLRFNDQAADVCPLWPSGSEAGRAAEYPAHPWNLGPFPQKMLKCTQCPQSYVARGHPSLLLSTLQDSELFGFLTTEPDTRHLGKKGNTCWKFRGAMELRLQVALPRAILSEACLMSSFISKGTFCFHISSSFSSTLPCSAPLSDSVFLLQQSAPTCAVSNLQSICWNQYRCLFWWRLYDTYSNYHLQIHRLCILGFTDLKGTAGPAI